MVSLVFSNAAGLAQTEQQLLALTGEKDQATHAADPVSAERRLTRRDDNKARRHYLPDKPNFGAFCYC